MATELATAYVTILPSTKGLGASLNAQLAPQMSAAGQTAGSSLSKGMTGGFAKIGSALAALGLVSFLKNSVAAAKVAEVSQTLLRNAVEQAGGSWASYGDKLESVIQKQSMLAAVDDEELGDALRSLIQATGDVDKATGLLGLTTDLARAKNMDLATASKLIGKVAMGNTSILTRYGIVLRKGATATEALAAIQQKFGGAAEAYGKTTQGSIDRANVAIENLQETIGASLLPTIGRFADSASGLLSEFDKLSPATKDTTVAIAGVGAAALIAAPWVKGLVGALKMLGSGGVVGGLVAISGAINYMTYQAVLPAQMAFGDWMRELTGTQDAQEGVVRSIITAVPAMRTYYDMAIGAGRTARIMGESTNFAADAADAAADAQKGLAPAIEETTAAWAAQELVLSDTQKATRSLTDNVVAAHSAEKARADFIKGGGKKGTAEYNQLVMKVADAYNLVDQSAANMTDSEIDAAMKSGTLSKAQGTLAKMANDAEGKIDGVASSLDKLPSSKTITIGVKVTDSPLHSMIAMLNKNHIKLGMGAIRFEVSTGKGKASGGIVSEPGIYPLAEKRREWVIDPLNANGPALIASAAQAAGMVAPSGGGVVTYITNAVTAYISNDYDVEKLAEKLQRIQSTRARAIGATA